MYLYLIIDNVSLLSKALAHNRNNVNKKLRKKREQELEDENQFLIDQYRIYKKRREVNYSTRIPNIDMLMF